MNLIERNLKYFIENHGDVYESYQEYGKSIDKDGGPLDEKTRRLIKVAISATIQNEYSLKTHIKKALRDDCTIEEIEHAILLVAPTVGFPAMMKALISIREEIGEETNPRDQSDKEIKTENSREAKDTEVNDEVQEEKKTNKESESSEESQDEDYKEDDE